MTAATAQNLKVLDVLATLENLVILEANGSLILKLLYLATIALGGTACTAVTALEAVLPHHLYALILLLRGEVGHIVGHQLRCHPVMEEGFDFDDLMDLLDGELIPLPHPHDMGGFESLLTHLHLARTASVGSVAAGLIKPHRPKVFVET